ncbi:MAG: T9SS type A sorting domain-containing protein [Flavobacteriales bacterium]|nr:T9SS type A sorting domain-containing protein [Flavobacteriales bacterium]
MQRFLKPFIILAIGGIIYLASIANYQWTDAQAYHGPQEINYFRANSIGLPLADNGYFKASGNCDGCHGFDPTFAANVNEMGHDISPVTYWRGTMMANAAKDPFWRAKVSHEVTINPQHKTALEDKCTTCHAPMGKYSHVEFSMGAYGMDDLETDSLGLDGVSCLACHKQSSQQLGNLNSGVLNFAPQPVAYGPFDKPFTAPMQDLVGIIPVQSNHILDAGLCAGCHTLLTESVDLNGNFTGGTFVEQATYHEWLNSAYNDGQSNATTCQGCHMPLVSEEVVVSANYPELFGRSPFAKHELVGGNSFMLKLLKQNAQTLGLSASDEVMDSTIARTERMLQHRTMNLDLTFQTFDSDTAYFELKLENLAGHKFPSGYPARRAFIEFLVIQDNGDTLFKSGVLQSNYEVMGQNATYEPHYDFITNEQQVQIYEMVMGDVNGNVTTILERAVTPIKDNRLAPLGFTTSHSAYDTTFIAGAALTDPNFNFDGFEGSGTDLVKYHVPLNGYNGNIKVTSKVFYQSAPPKWMQEMFATSTPTIDAFETMYNNADQSPVLIAADSILNINVVTGITNRINSEITAYPNPTMTGKVRLKGDNFSSIIAIEIYDVRGRLISKLPQYTQEGINLPLEKGVYLLRIKTVENDSILKVYRSK